MTPERRQQIDLLFHAALACDPPQREEFLAVNCAGDESLRFEVESLISSHEHAQFVNETPSRKQTDAHKSEAHNEPESGTVQEEISGPGNAYQAYQLSRYYFQKVSFPDLSKSRTWLEAAVRLDPHFAPAHAALAEQCVMEAITGLHSPAESFPHAKEALRRASELNMNSAEFYTVAGFVDLICDWDFAGAELNLRKSLEINSACAFANHYLGHVLMFQGRAVEAGACLQHAVEIEPMNLHHGMVLTISYYLARDYQKTIEECERLLAIYPRFVVARSYRSMAWEQLGRAAEAIDEYERILREPGGEIARRFMGFAYALIDDRENALKTAEKLDAESFAHYLSPTCQAVLYAALDERDKAFSYLQKGLAERDPWMLWIGTDPRLDCLRSDPRFGQLLEQVGLKSPAGSHPSQLLPSIESGTLARRLIKRRRKVTPERWSQINELFHQALAREKTERQQFLSARCNDEELRVEVESLISSHEAALSFIETGAGDIAAELLGANKSAFQAGEQIGNYTIVRQLGSGGMGIVYLADDTRLKRKVALKLLPAHFTVNPDRVRRFEREARAASALNHPNMVTIYEIGQSNSTHFIATEFVDGKTLRELINERPFTLSEALNVGIQVGAALAGAHEAGIVHRDIKPENIMVRSDGYVKVLDLGLAKLTEQQTAAGDLETPTLLQSNPGLVMGTVQYMSPEQARAKRVDGRTDIWSLGIVLYELLSGHVPFSGDTPSHVMVSLMEDQLPPLEDYASVPAQLNRIVARALRKNQKERYQNASHLARDLKHLKRDLQVKEQLKGLLETVPAGKEPKSGAQTSSGGKRSATETVLFSGEGTVLRRPTFSAQFLSAELKRHKYFVAAALLLLLAGAIGLTYFIRKQNKTNAGPNRPTSIAVLPFKPANSTIHDEIYEIGIADSLIHRLSSIDGLVVRPLSATRQYSGTLGDVILAGKEQQVDYVLVSNYQLSDGKIRVTSQLLNVANRLIEVTYQGEKDAAKVFAVQDAIADDLGNMLMTRFRTSTRRPEAKRGTTSEEAYRLYLQAMYLYAKRTEQASIQAIKLLDQAVGLDPNYALAWAGKAHAHRYAANLGRDTDTHSEYKKSMEAINRALSLNKDSSEAYSALCENKYYYEFDFPGAETACKRAVALDPNSSMAHEIYGRFLYHRGRFPEGIKELETAVDLEPASLFNQRNLGIAFYYAGLYDKAKAQFKRVIEMDGNFKSAYSWMRNSLEMQGNYAEAFDWFLQGQGVLGTDWQTIQLYKRIYKKSGYQAVLREYVGRFDQSINQYYVGALLEADIGNKDKAFEYLEIAYQRREWGINSLLIERRLDPIRDDPRFGELVSRVGLK